MYRDPQIQGVHDPFQTMYCYYTEITPPPPQKKIFGKIRADAREIREINFNNSFISKPSQFVIVLQKGPCTHRYERAYLYALHRGPKIRAKSQLHLQKRACLHLYKR